MKLEEVLLRKEELPIIGENRFQVPIYPSLLKEDVVFDTTMAAQVFPWAAKEWYDDLTIYARNLPESSSQEKEKKRWLQESYLDKPVKVVRENGRQIVTPPGFWEDLVGCDKRGFATHFSISRNAGGSLYLGNDFEREQFAFAKLVKFDEDKKRTYCIDESCNKMIMYSMHNVDYYQGALFLRNWVMLYLNSALKELERQGKL